MRIAVRTEPGRLVLLDAEDVYYVEADRHTCRIRTARRRMLSSVRSLSEWEERLTEAGFARIHRSYLVNLSRVMEVRLREGDTNDWEVRLAPPVNKVLPVSRSLYPGLVERLGG